MRARHQVRALYLRNLGATWFLAFRSLRRQVLGLYGSRGLSPIREQLELRARYEPRPLRRWTRWPTLLWLGASDRALVRLCRIGEASGLLLALGIAPRLSALCTWASYLSFVTVGAPFLSYQWDALILEAGLQSAVLAPGTLRLGHARTEPTQASIWALRWLAARLHFESGIVKLQSGDRTWRKLEAMRYHHATQPLPTPLGWYANQLPRRAHQLSTAGVLGVELVPPVMALMPRPLRQIAFTVLVTLQLSIGISGNYGFFNLLSAQLCLPLLDDDDLRALTPWRRRSRPRRRLAPAPLSREVAEAAVLAPFFVSSADSLLARFWPHRRPALLRRVEATLRQFHAVNPYGLFAVMTTSRPEIVIEGSNDGRTWREFELPYKPVRLNRRPPFAGTHMPRLDWQLWFAALGMIDDWFLVLMQRLLEGTPEVYALFGHNPFPAGPPRYVRALLYDYRMTTFAERRATGRWWTRDRVGILVRPTALPAGREAPSPP
ncbi:MAG: lipase maturation factor family protein [Myxococcaceae bacterium]|nr:lipase maturation factor family protein [Myxococcaceae bacterium]